jgi:hypothetical protein
MEYQKTIQIIVSKLHCHLTLVTFLSGNWLRTPTQITGK